MPAFSENFPWPSYYGHFKFFEMQMRRHRRVSALIPIDDALYELTLASGQILRVFICECYSYGAAEYLETTEKLGEIDAIIINSKWCGYTPEAKRLCRNDKVGLFTLTDFMTALNRKEIWLYLNAKEAESLREEG